MYQNCKMTFFSQGTRVLVVALCVGLSLAVENCQLRIDKYERASMMSRNFLYGRSNLWPGGVVPYAFGFQFSARDRSIIQAAMNQIQTGSCVRFVQRTNQRQYALLVRRESGCYTRGSGFTSARPAHVVNLGPGCMTVGIVVHELLHVLGFLHEQNRPDRNRFISIRWENIREEASWFGQFIRSKAPGERIATCNFNVLRRQDDCASPRVATTLGQPYDYRSVMHYGRIGPSKNGRPTMTSGTYRGELGNRAGLTSIDRRKINAAYQCNGGGQQCNDTWRLCRSYTRFCTRSSFMRTRCRRSCRLCN